MTAKKKEKKKGYKKKENKKKSKMSTTAAVDASPASPTTTQYVRESIASRLFPLRQSIEEFNACRDMGMNNFTNQEPAVERLLNALDFIFNTDVLHPGEFFMFMKSALEDVPRTLLSHKPMEEVVERQLPDVQDSFRLWLIFSLNLTGSLKVSLHAALVKKDVLMCFVQPNSLLLGDVFIDELLGLLATLHNPPMADGQTIFQLDAGALQLFEERPIEVQFVPKRRTQSRIVKRTTTAAAAAGAEGGVAARRKAGSVAQRSHRSDSIHSSHTNNAGTPRTASELLQQQVKKVEDGTQTEAVLLGAAVPQAHVPQSDASVNTDHPSTLMSFSELLEAQEELEQQRLHQKTAHEALKAAKEAAEQTKQDYVERLELITGTLRQLKKLLNELQMEKNDAEEQCIDFQDIQIDERILDVFEALQSGTTSSTPAAVRAALDREKGRVSVPTSSSLRPRVGDTAAGSSSFGQVEEKPRTPSSSLPPQHPRTQSVPTGHVTAAPPHSTETEPSSATLRARTTSTANPINNNNNNTTAADEKPSQDAASSSSKSGLSKPPQSSSSSSTVKKNSLLSLQALREEASVSSPPVNEQMVPYENTKLVLSEPHEFERTQQLSLQANRCVGCGSSFGDEAEDRSVVLKVVQRAGEKLRFQKPRRCHYCVKLFCHKCHTNKMAVLPFRVLQKWDFSPEHVCNKDYEFLSKNYEKAFYALSAMPQELQSRPSMQQCALLRKKIVIICRIMVTCTDPSASAFTAFLHTHYAQRHQFYSLADFNRVKNGEGNKLLQTAVSPINAVSSLVYQGSGTHQMDDFVAFMTSQYAKMLSHVKECPVCVKKSSATCYGCNEPQMISLVDEDTTQCKVCNTLYHKPCLEMLGSCTACRVN